MRQGCFEPLRVLGPLVLSGVLVSGGLACAGPEVVTPIAPEQVGFEGRAETAEADGVRARTAVLSGAEAKEVYGVSLESKGIQVVWLEVSNALSEPLWFMPAAIDREYYSSLEAAWRIGLGGDGEKARAVQDRLAELEMPFRIDPGRTASGFVLTRQDVGVKVVPVVLVGLGGTYRELLLLARIPGFKVDADQSKEVRARLNREASEVGLEQLRGLLEQLPCCITDKAERNYGDPVNVVLIGMPNDILQAIVRSGWHLTEPLSVGAAWKTATAWIAGKEYKTSPISSLYYFGRPQDVAFQKPRENVNARNHMRYWLTPWRLGGRSVWVGQISRDVGVKFSTKTFPTTHVIDEDVDDTRNYLLQDLLLAQSVAAFGLVKGVGEAPRDAPRRNLGGDPYFTDGRRLVVVVSPQPVALDEVGFLPWEKPKPAPETERAPEPEASPVR